MPDDLLTQDEERKKLSAQDPLFYEGKTPVLGQDVSITEPAGELSMPEAGAAPPAAPTPPGAGPTQPQWPGFPEFDLTMPEFNFNPGQPPGAPGGEFPQPPEVPWWQKALAVGDQASDTYQKAKKAYDASQNAQAGGTTPEWAQTNPDLYSLGGAEPADWFTGQGGLYNLTGEGVPEGLGAGADPYNLGAGDMHLYTGEAGDVAPTSGLGNYVGPALSVLGAGMGAYNAYNAPAGSPQQISGALGAASGVAGAAGALGGSALGGSMGLGALAPAAGAAWPLAALALPYVTGQLWERYGPPSADKIQTPPGWAYVPGTGNSRGVGGYVVDPASGRVMQYNGQGQWAQAGRMTPQQFKQYQIEPTGALAQQAEYGGVPTEIRNEDIAAAGQPISQGGAPGVPTEAHQRSYLEEWRQPYINQLKAQYPTADEGELWRLYTQTPEYQQELGMQAGWNQGAG